MVCFKILVYSVSANYTFYFYRKIILILITLQNLITQLFLIFITARITTSVSTLLSG